MTVVEVLLTPAFRTGASVPSCLTAIAIRWSGGPEARVATAVLRSRRQTGSPIAKQRRASRRRPLSGYATPLSTLKGNGMYVFRVADRGRGLLSCGLLVVAMIFGMVMPAGADARYDSERYTLEPGDEPAPPGQEFPQDLGVLFEQMNDRDLGDHLVENYDGVRDGMTVTLPDGTEFVEAGALATACQNGFICVFSGASYTGTRVNFVGGSNSWVDMGPVRNTMSSVENITQGKVRFYDYNTGAYWCINPYTRRSTVPSYANNTMDILYGHNDGACT